MSQTPPYPAYSSDAVPSYHTPAPQSSFDPSTPPPPPPKPLSHEASRRSTPQNGPPLPPPPSGNPNQPLYHRSNTEPPPVFQNNPQPPPPEEGWLPSILKDKSKTDLATLLSDPTLLAALTNNPQTTHPSLPNSLSPLQAALNQNIDLATHILALSAQLDSLRQRTQSQLLQSHALERAWRQKQTLMDDTLAPFSPKALYQRLALSVGEAEQVCAALEESFLEGEGRAGEREVGEFVKRFREGRKGVWIRRERKERWDEGRVGGWR
ncbi:hypothetical protein MMC08_002395 [Hypocenomyce scalaris]|nr:hypothetical protein [Hypocenomyce scalaris]